MRKQAVKQENENNSMENALEALGRALPDGPIKATES